jgi:hypothetical protein
MRYLDQRRDRASERFRRVRVLILVASVIVAAFVSRQLIVGEPGNRRYDSAAFGVCGPGSGRQ